MVDVNKSILNSTKKILGLAPTYTPFDLDVITHINTAFSTLNQLGLGPDGGFAIEDESELWTDLDLPTNQLSAVKTYVYLKTRMLFDPPNTSYHVTSMNDQIRELEWRLNVLREDALTEEVA